MSSARASRRSHSPDTLPGEQPGLRRIVQTRLLKDVFDATSEKDPGWKILIVDEHSMRVISTAVGMYDIMERKVTLVESINKKRAAFPEMGAIYVLEPSEESVRALVADFSATPLYGKLVFLYFLGRLPDNLLEELKRCQPLLKRLQCLVEVNIDFLAKEERAFTFDMRDVFASSYLRQGTTQSELVIAKKLVTVCATLNEYPHIRYKESSGICNSLALVFKVQMDEFVTNNPTWWYHGGPKKHQAATKERATMLLLDRADDPLTPLMHDFTYQAMVHDLLAMEGDCVTVHNDAGKETDVLLDEKDSVWVELRGKHIAAVIETLSNRIREIMNSGTGSALNTKQGEGTMSLSQMAAALKALPEYQEVLSKLSQHMHLSHECMDRFTAQSLLDLADWEQTLAIGKDDGGRSPKIADIMDQAENFLLTMKTIPDKLRLILVAAIACQGLRVQDKRRLASAAGLTAKEMGPVDALEVLGVSVINDNVKNRNITGLPNRQAAEEDSEYASTRYVPVIKSILEDLSNDQLSMEEYPSVTPMPTQSAGAAGRSNTSRSTRKSTGAGAAASARKTVGASSKWSSNAGSNTGSGIRTSGPVNYTGARNLVFIVGGLCYPELRTVREVMENESREIIVGSTSFLSANDFIDDLTKVAGQNQ